MDEMKTGTDFDSRKEYLEYMRNLDYDHLDSEQYEEVEALFEDAEWNEHDMELLAVVAFNGDPLARFDEFPPESLYEKIDEDEECRDQFLSILKKERDILGTKLSPEDAQDIFEEIVELLEEDDE